MTVQPDDLVEQVGPDAVHHAHHDHQRRDPQRHRNEAERRGDEDEAFAALGEQIAFEDGAFIRTQDHGASGLFGAMRGAVMASL
jgi:hypothetical protein